MATTFTFTKHKSFHLWMQMTGQHAYRYIIISRIFLSFSLPRGLLLLLGITSNKKEQAVKPNDLDGITSNLLQTENVHDPGQTVARSLLQPQEGQTEISTLTEWRKKIANVTFLSSNPHFYIVPALQTSFVWKGGVCFTTEPGRIEFLTCLCSLSTKTSNYIQQNLQDQMS